MLQNWILYPLFAMFLLSLIVSLRTLQLRYRAVYRDKLNPIYFKLNRGGKPPAYMVQAEQHYVNLYETPVLFYVIVLLIFILNMTSMLLLVLSWLYVAARLVHAVIHMTSNRIIWRRNVFFLSVAILSVMWFHVFRHLLFS